MRTSSVVSKLIADTHNQRELDQAQLVNLKARLITNPSDEMVKKQINALRTTLVNSREDLDDLESEMQAIVAFEKSEAGQARRQALQDKLKVADALASVCLATAHRADDALGQALYALHKHHAAHDALREALGAAYGSITEGSGYDTHGDQAHLIFGYASLANDASALAEWVIEALKGYDVHNHIQVHGITHLNHREHLTLQGTEAVNLSRCISRLREVATKVGHEVPSQDDASLPGLRTALLAAVEKARLQ